MLLINIQKTIAEKICLIINKKLIKVPRDIIGNNNETDFLLMKLLSISEREEWINMLRLYDYVNNAPAIITLSNNPLTWDECLLLLLTNLIGIDVVVINPSGMADIENYIIEDLLDIHYLENQSTNFKYKRKFFSDEKIIKEF